ncbi:MAG: flagellar biosynthetic protein FliO [Terriglobales bacterium]|jgi:flagellar biogenesis protein FliO
MEIRPLPLILKTPRKPGNRFAPLLAGIHKKLQTIYRALVRRTLRRPKSLVLVESSALGDRRFVTVVEFEGQRFLIGSSPSSVSLLARLPDAAPGSGAAIAAIDGEER